MKNIDVFDLYVAAIFSELYEEFPVPTTLDFMDIPTNEVFKDDDVHDELVSKIFIYRHTIVWLLASGYIQAENVNEQRAYDVTLSAKGLGLMKLPSSLEGPKESFGESVTKALKSGARNIAISQINMALTRGISCFPFAS